MARPPTAAIQARDTVPSATEAGRWRDFLLHAAIIALACREIVVAPGSVFGDAAPISVMPGLGLQPLPAAERAKFESPILDELDAAAAKRGEDRRLLHAFVVDQVGLDRAGTDGIQRLEGITRTVQMFARLDGARALDDLVQLLDVAHVHGNGQAQTLEVTVEAGGLDETVITGILGGDGAGHNGYLSGIGASF
jgi:hypothetical protein